MRCVRTLLHDRAGLACLLFLGIVLLAALLAPWLAPWDPLAVDGSRKLAPCGPEHWLGTDRLGRDIFSRLLYGARATLGVSLLAMGATVTLGALLGMLAGLVRGRVEACLMRLCDVMLSFPGEVMVLAIVGMLGPGLENVVLACLVAKWPWYARMMRTVTLRYADRDFVRFARVAGYGTGHIIRRHLLPCAAGEISVLATLDTGAVILMVSALSFLGLGVQPPTPEWGMMLGEAREVMVLYPWQMLPPGLAILLVVATAACLRHRGPVRQAAGTGRELFAATRTLSGHRGRERQRQEPALPGVAGPAALRSGQERAGAFRRPRPEPS